MSASFWKTAAPLAVVGLALLAVIAWASWIPSMQGPIDVPFSMDRSANETARRVDSFFEDLWRVEQLSPAEPADELQVLRRLSLVLHGTVPSLQEIRRFEAESSSDRLARWTAAMLVDRRFADYFAERLARSFVGVEQGQFIVFRRDRFVDWLAGELAANRPYDQLVREMIADRGLWTGEPETNFITATAVEGKIDENKLAGRSVRAFLGQRIDCAQCHNHPFADWKQGDFEGLAAHFAQTQISIVGVEDRTHTKQKQPLEFEIEDRSTLEKRVVAPSVPFGHEWLPETGTRRERLAAWITHSENRRFERAIVNRVWGLMFGRPWHEPVDDLPDPARSADEAPDPLDVLGRDFREHGYDLKWLIQSIAATRVFRLDSKHSADSVKGDPKLVSRLAEQWAVFPMTRLRPEQIIGAMLQGSSLQTIDRNSHLIIRTVRFFREREFVERYGDLGEDELERNSATIPQALLRMNGQLANEILEVNPLSATGRILAFSGTGENLLDASFLVCLSRRPTKDEQAALLPLFDVKNRHQREQAIEDLYWTLFNSVEFSWMH